MTQGRDRAWLWVALTALFAAFVVTLAPVLRLPRTDAKAIGGAWSAKTAAARVQMAFNSDGTCSILIRDSETGASELWTGKYVFNPLSKPMALTIQNIAQMKRSLNTIVEFDGPDRIKMAYFSTVKQARPLNFDPQTTLLLKRSS